METGIQTIKSSPCAPCLLVNRQAAAPNFDPYPDMLWSRFPFGISAGSSPAPVSRSGMSYANKLSSFELSFLLRATTAHALRVTIADAFCRAPRLRAAAIRSGAFPAARASPGPYIPDSPAGSRSRRSRPTCRAHGRRQMPPPRRATNPACQTAAPAGAVSGADVLERRRVTSHVGFSAMLCACPMTGHGWVGEWRLS